MFDPSKAKLQTTCKAPGILYALCHDVGQGKLYGAGADWSTYCVDLNAEQPTAEKKWTSHENYVAALAFVNGVVISAGYDRRLVWTNGETGQQIRTVNAHEGWVRDLKVFPDGSRMASVGDDLLVKVWDVETGKLHETLDGHAKQSPQGYATAIYTADVAPDGRHIASGDRIGAVCIWDAESGKLVRQLRAPAFYTYDPLTRVRSIGGIRSLRFSPDGSMLAIAGIGKVTNVDGFVGPCRVELWDWQAGKHLRTVQDKHKAVLNDVVFHPANSHLVAAGGGDSGGILAFWDTKREQFTHKAKPKGHLQRILIDASAQQLFAVGHDGFQLWDLAGD